MDEILLNQLDKAQEKMPLWRIVENDSLNLFT